MVYLRQRYRPDVLEDSNGTGLAYHISHATLADTFLHTATITTPDSAPSTNADGFECGTAQQVAIAVQNLSSVSGWAAVVWAGHLLAGTMEWARIDTVVGMSTSWANVYLLAGARRVFLQITSLTGTSLDVAYRLL